MCACTCSDLGSKGWPFPKHTHTPAGSRDLSRVERWQLRIYIYMYMSELKHEKQTT